MSDKEKKSKKSNKKKGKFPKSLYDNSDKISQKEREKEASNNAQVEQFLYPPTVSKINYPFNFCRIRMS